MATQVQTLDEAVCISHSTNPPGKDIQVFSLQIWVNSSVMATCLGERNL